MCSCHIGANTVNPMWMQLSSMEHLRFLLSCSHVQCCIHIRLSPDEILHSWDAATSTSVHQLWGNTSKKKKDSQVLLVTLFGCRPVFTFRDHGRHALL